MKFTLTTQEGETPLDKVMMYEGQTALYVKSEKGAAPFAIIQRHPIYPKEVYQMLMQALEGIELNL